MESSEMRIAPPPSQELLSRLARWANERDTVRAVLLTSTRARPEAATDLFSDFDVILAVTDPEPYYADRTWLSDFGKVLVLYRDPLRALPGGTSFAYITQYESGLKIDFTVQSADILRLVAAGDELPADLDVGYRVLLDKDDLTEGLRDSSFSAYVPKRPSEDEYLTLVEEFFHEATYVAKHLWRNDLLPAKYNLDHAMKQLDLRKMLEWHVETERGWSVPTRAYGKGLRAVLPAGVWEALERTYVGAGVDENWDALFATTELFRGVATEVGKRLGFAYPRALDDRVTAYLEAVRKLGGRR